MKGRSVIGNIPRPVYNVQERGIVVVDIVVDNYGNVVRATPGGEGTNVLDKNLYAAARNAAMDTHFNMSADAPAMQEGTISRILRKSNTREEDSALNTSRASTASAEATVRTVAMATAVASAVEEATDRTVAATATAGKVAEAILPTVEEATADTKADTATTARSADRASTANAGATARTVAATATAGKAAKADTESAGPASMANAGATVRTVAATERIAEVSDAAPEGTRGPLREGQQGPGRNPLPSRAPGCSPRIHSRESTA